MEIPSPSLVAEQGDAADRVSLIATPTNPARQQKKPKGSPGLGSLCLHLPEVGFSLEMGEEGLEPPTSTV